MLGIERFVLSRKRLTFWWIERVRLGNGSAFLLRPTWQRGEPFFFEDLVDGVESDGDVLSREGYANILDGVVVLA
jgi:hypothetical protein